MMQRQLLHMTRLVDDLLDVPRITHGHIELRKEPVELSTVLKDAIESARPFAVSANQELLLRLPPEELMLDADPVRLTQIFTNLLNNAIKYSDRGGIVELGAVHKGDHV